MHICTTDLSDSLYIFDQLFFFLQSYEEKSMKPIKTQALILLVFNYNLPGIIHLNNKENNKVIIRIWFHRELITLKHCSSPVGYSYSYYSYISLHSFDTFV